MNRTGLLELLSHALVVALILVKQGCDCGGIILGKSEKRLDEIISATSGSV